MERFEPMVDRIAKVLPKNYGEIHINFNCIDNDNKGRVGVVIPSFRRPKYVEPFLQSLIKTDLKNAVLCFVDESEADIIFKDYSGYRLYKYMDLPGNDLENDQQSYKMPLDVIKKQCDENLDCLGFNTFGYLKSKIKPSCEFRNIPHAVCGLYVKEQAAGRLGTVKEPLPDPNNGFKTAGLIKDFTIDSVPTIKLFKRKHGNMFESLRVGWDLLKDFLQCEYLCCLDSDTLLKKDWLLQLHRTYQVIEETMTSPYFLLTGFNADSHPVLEAHERYYMKASLGGINLFFTRNIYPALRPSLNHVQWDHEMERRIKLLKGRFFCTRPSVIQHIGKHGLWSYGTYDVAEDFDA